MTLVKRNNSPTNKGGERNGQNLEDAMLKSSSSKEDSSTSSAGSCDSKFFRFLFQRYKVIFMLFGIFLLMCCLIGPTPIPSSFDMNASSPYSNALNSPLVVDPKSASFTYLLEPKLSTFTLSFAQQTSDYSSSTNVHISTNQQEQQLRDVEISYHPEQNKGQSASKTKTKPKIIKSINPTGLVKVKLQINRSFYNTIHGDKKHNNNIVWMFLDGDAFIPIKLQETTKAKGGYVNMEGTFSFPIEGHYFMNSLITTTDRQETKHQKPTIQFKQLMSINFIQPTNGESDTNDIKTRLASSGSAPLPFFGTGAWLSSNIIASAQERLHENSTGQTPLLAINNNKDIPYKWVNPKQTLHQSLSFIESKSLKSDALDETTSSKIVLAKEGTVANESTSSPSSPSSPFYLFEELGNYELVCWIGSKSAQDIHTSFLNLRPQLFDEQRPFKFHYYESHNFVTPDETWNMDQKTKFRKCKHILISIDQPQSTISGREYQSQVTNFINHLLKVFPDETFPIWMFTVMESPLMASNCHTHKDDPSSVWPKQTTEHPCNVILRELFDAKTFPSRVHLLDNTDLSSIQILSDAKGDTNRTNLSTSTSVSHSNIYQDVVAMVALRIFVLVGEKVKVWRDAGQRGGVDGLTRNGVLEPNFELIPYDWSSPL